MNHALVQGLVQAVDDAHADETIKSIIINAEGRAFSAGADIKEAATRADATVPKKLGAISTVRAVSTNSAREPTNRLSPPFTATSSAAAATSRSPPTWLLQGETAVFGYPEVKRGLATTMVTPGLVHRIGPKAAFELLTLAEDITAVRTLELGLINRVVPDDKI